MSPWPWARSSWTPSCLINPSGRRVWTRVACWKQFCHRRCRHSSCLFHQSSSSHHHCRVLAFISNHRKGVCLGSVEWWGESSCVLGFVGEFTGGELRPVGPVAVVNGGSRGGEGEGLGPCLPGPSGLQVGPTRAGPSERKREGSSWAATVG
jgi:hypothetical protein